MPELPEVERIRRLLEPAMAGARFERVILNRSDLRQPFPADFARRLRRQTVRTLGRRGKYLLAELSSGDTLLMHLGMSGWFRVEPTKPVNGRRRDPEAELDHRHDHVIFAMSSGRTVTFTDPRRFGVMDLITPDRAPPPRSLQRMGPEPLTRAFNAYELARRCASRRVALKVALLDQRIVAGIGNIYASEALLSPFRPASTIATSTGRPRANCERLVSAIKAVLRRAISLKESERYRETRFRVYDRAGEPCTTPGCRGIIAQSWQAGRSTFHCPVCQR